MIFPEFYEKHQKIDDAYKLAMKKVCRMKKEEIEEYIKLVETVWKSAILLLEYEFKNALFLEYGVINNPKREQAFKKAHNYGHSNGYAGIESQFRELTNLMEQE